MHTAEGQFVVASFLIDGSGRQRLARRFVHPSAQAVVGVGQQVAGRLPVVGQQGGVGTAFQVMLVEGGQVDIRQDVGVGH